MAVAPHSGHRRWGRVLTTYLLTAIKKHGYGCTPVNPRGAPLISHYKRFELHELWLKNTVSVHFKHLSQ